MESAQGQLQVRFAPVTVKWAIEMTNKFILSFSSLETNIPDSRPKWAKSIPVFTPGGFITFGPTRQNSRLNIEAEICEILRIF